MTRPALTLMTLLLACGQPDAPPTAGATDAGATASQPGQGHSPSQGKPPPGGDQAGAGLDQGQQHPPLPADNPAWDWDAGGFVPDFGWYGEHSWNDVRMRLGGHIAVAARDRARLIAEMGDYAGASDAYSDLATRLGALSHDANGPNAQIHALLLAAAQRDAALTRALADGTALPTTNGSLAPLRVRTLALAREAQNGTPNAELAERARAIQQELTPHATARTDLAIDNFKDFDDRHALRVRLFDAALDSLDPLGLDERWGYWRASEIQRQAAILTQTLATLGGDQRALPDGVIGDIGEIAQVAPLRRASVLAERLRSADQTPEFTINGVGWLPTGDSLIDVGAQPGPQAIGTLMRLGLDDPEHVAWLQQQADAMNAALETDPTAVASLVTQATEVVDAYGHGSRYYNIKQLRNDAIRQLTRSGRADLALPILRSHWPLHNQDWACPNRQGILLALEGRLLAEASQPGAAAAKLKESLAAATDFLALVDAAESAAPGEGPGRRPPMMGGPGGPAGQGQPGGPVGPPPPNGPQGGGQRNGPPGPPPNR